MVLAIRNGLWNAFAQVIGALTGIAGSVLIVRGLSPEAYGAFSYYVWLAGLISTLGTLAFPSTLTKITSELHGGREHSEARALSRTVALVLFGLNLALSGGILAWAFQTPISTRTYLLIVAAFLVPNALGAIFRSTLWGREHYSGVSVTETVSALLQFALVVVATLAQWGAPGYVAVVLVGSIVRAIGLALTLRRPSGATNPPRAARLPGRSTLRRYLVFCAPATLALLFYIVIWERSEVFFLERLSTLKQVGFYNLAYTTYAMFLGLGWALVNGFYPSISRDYGAGEWSRIREKVRQGVILATVFAVPLSLGGWVTLEALIALLYGQHMQDAAPVARILFIGLLPGVVASVLGFTMSAVGNAWLTVRLGVVLAALNIALDLLLIPHFGALGGAIANTGAQVMYTVLLLFVVRRRYRIELPWRILAGIVGLGVLTTLLLPSIIQRWSPGIWGLISAIVVGGACYILGIWSLGYLRLLRTEENDDRHAPDGQPRAARLPLRTRRRDAAARRKDAAHPPVQSP
jgi:O-antigen/teichoic acid export membrane protein